MIRTPEQYLESLRDGRVVYLDGERIPDITKEPKMRGAINAVAMAMAGGSSPVHLAGTLVAMNCEVLSTLVLNQLTAKGAPFIYGSSTCPMDLRHATSSVGSPELGMISAAVARLARYYSLPCFVAGG